MQDWLLQHEVWIGAATVISVVTFVATVAAIPMVIARIPEDYFVREPTPPWPHLSRKLRILLIVLKNLVGAVLLLAGLAMLVLPGQGLLTILVAITLLDFRGKRRLERWIIRQKPVYRVAQWIRTKRNRPPLKLPGRPSQDPSNL